MNAEARLVQMAGLGIVLVDVLVYRRWLRPHIRRALGITYH